MPRFTDFCLRGWHTHTINDCVCDQGLPRHADRGAVHRNDTEQTVVVEKTGYCTGLGT
jgi:hypothetical protein